MAGAAGSSGVILLVGLRWERCLLGPLLSEDAKTFQPCGCSKSHPSCF